MAIALDAVSNETATITSPATWTHTCTGSNLVLVVGVVVSTSGSPTISTPTYNGAGMTLIGSQRTFGSGLYKVALYYLLNPATGTNTVSVAFGGFVPNCDAGAVSYTGVAQSGQPNAIAGASNITSANPSVTVTTIADNCWVLGILGEITNNPTAGLTQRFEASAACFGNFEDTNGPKTPAGNQTVNWTAAAEFFGAVIQAASFSPAVATSAVKQLAALGVG